MLMRVETADCWEPLEGLFWYHSEYFGTKSRKPFKILKLCMIISQKNVSSKS